MQWIEQSGRCFSKSLMLRLQRGCPSRLAVLGNPDPLRQPLTALFCSTKCQGQVILRDFDQVAQFRDTGRAVISSFNTPVEKECLAILFTRNILYRHQLRPQPGRVPGPGQLKKAPGRRSHAAFVLLTEGPVPTHGRDRPPPQRIYCRSRHRNPYPPCHTRRPARFTAPPLG